jgi:flavin-dependent dehydrogenase
MSSYPDWDTIAETTWDAIVIGAGPAGALAARQLAAGGARALLVERRVFPRSKVCGCCLNGQALAVLRSAGLGSLVAELGGVELDEFQLRYRGRVARLALPMGAVISRARLDAALVAAAIDSGAQYVQETRGLVDGVRGGTRVVRLVQSRGAIEVDARVVLVATGLGSLSLAADAKAETRIAAGSRIGAGCVVPDAPEFYDPRTVFMAVAREGYVGMVRLEGGSLNVAAALEPGFVRRSGGPGDAAAAVLADAGFPPIVPLGRLPWQGTVGLTRRTRPIAASRLFLLGDATGYVEPFTGEGIAWALASGEAIAPLALRAIERWEPHLAREWDGLHRRLVRRRQLVCRAAAAALHRPWLAHLGFEFLTRLPGAVRRILLHLNAPPLLSHAS